MKQRRSQVFTYTDFFAVFSGITSFVSFLSDKKIDLRVAVPDKIFVADTDCVCLIAKRGRINYRLVYGRFRQLSGEELGSTNHRAVFIT